MWDSGLQVEAGPMCRNGGGTWGTGRACGSYARPLEKRQEPALSEVEGSGAPRLRPDPNKGRATRLSYPAGLRLRNRRLPSP